MVASPLAFFRRDGAIWMASFLFVLHGLVSDAYAWQAVDPAWMNPTTQVRERIERASREQWLGLVTASARATLGETWQQVAGPMPSDDLPASKRVPWLLDRIDRWTQSQAFAQHQTRTWIIDRCCGQGGAAKGWDFHLHDAWINHSIANNESYLRFLQAQIAGDLLLGESDDRLGTSTWFRCAESIRDTDLRSREPSRRIPTRSSPSLDELPASLKWTSVSDLPWLHCEVSESQRARLLDLDRAIESVWKSELRDWKRLLQEESVANWYRSQTSWPRPNPSEMTFSLSDVEGMEPADAANVRLTPYAIENPWRSTQPWTAILEFELHDAGAVANADPMPLVRQRASIDHSGEFTNSIIALREGRVVVRLVHALPNSYLEIETEPIVRAPGVYSLAVVYDGLPSVDGLRLWLDGRWLETYALHALLVRDFASNDVQVLEIASNSGNSGVRVTQLESYRSCLSPLELEGWRQSEEWKEWEDCSEEQRYAARDHYARRLDAQWRYQRESLSFYVSSFGSLLSRVGMVPVADSQGAVGIPKALAFASGAKHDIQGWNADKRRKLGWECERSVSEIVASNEIARQWTRMLASIEGNTKAGSLDEPGLRTGLSKPWSQSWNRRELIRAILVSEAWLSTALDSMP
jgi:hypothetical protein